MFYLSIEHPAPAIEDLISIQDIVGKKAVYLCFVRLVLMTSVAYRIVSLAHLKYC